jgi:hypothetical protein
MTTGSSPVLLRSLIVYGVCIVLAIFIGYLAAEFGNYQDSQSLGFIGFTAAILIFPLMMKWHYPLLVFSWSLPISLFLLPGRPNLFLLMVGVSLTISVIERILNREQQFLPAGGIRWPLLFLVVVIIFTAKMSGGFGLRAMGSEVYGGKKYVFLMAGIVGFFALTARPIPKKQAYLYLGLFFGGSLFAVIGDLFAITPSPLRFIFLFFPPSGGADALGNYEIQLGVTRLGGISTAAVAAFTWMIARYGFRESLLTPKLWRPALLVVLAAGIMLGGFRSAILGILLLLTVLFFLEKLHRTGLVVAVAMLTIGGGTLLVPLAKDLPFTFQRALAFLPLDLTPDARMNAEATSEWRIEMWTALLPQIPQYLLLGKGYAFSAETFDESIGSNATFQHVIDASDISLALSSDFHNGPLSVVIPFGIWGVIGWLWFWIAGFRVVWKNYRYGDPDLRHINLFLFAAFIVRCVMFLAVVGDMVSDMTYFAAITGLSIAFNHGVASRPAIAPAARPAAAPQTGSRLGLPARPAFQR